MGKKNKGREDEKCYTSKDLKEESRKKGFRMPELGLSKRIFLYILTIALGGLSLMSVLIKDMTNNPVFQYLFYVIYALAAGGLGISGYYLVINIRRITRENVKPAIEANPFTNRLASDSIYRAFLFALPGLGTSMVYAVFNGVVAIYSRSFWYLTFFAYYLLLSIMRYGVLWLNRQMGGFKETKEKQIREWKAYKNCGILLVVMNIALTGAVVLIIYSRNTQKRYAGFLIYAVAFYTFYKVIMAVLNTVKAGKTKLPLVMTLRRIGYADALVSLLSLQVAMLTAFSEPAAEYISVMNTCTGLGVCIMVLLAGVGMIVNGIRHIRLMKIEDE